ncbi:MAG: SET domain-containing protein [Acidobacteriota bacterium]
MQRRSEALYLNPKIEVADSALPGYGVFANRPIRAGEILEECPVLILPLESDALFDYRFRWPKVLDYRGYAIPLGFGCIYNHQDDPNADWDSDEERRLFIYRAIKDISAGEEIFISYNFGEDYWANRPHLTKRLA